MKLKKINRFSKSQSSLEYALIIAVLIGAFLGVQAYIGRSLKGQIQASTDQMADQYAYGLTDLHEHFTSSAKTTEINAPGPVTWTKSKGSYSSFSEKKIRPLEEFSIEDLR